MLKRCPEIVEIKIVPHNGDILERAISHQIGKEADRITR
jgi:hypothetical protein